MIKAPLLEELLKYHKEENLILSMPGNKCGKGFERDELGGEFLKSGISLDITEVDPLDNLHNPEGVIEESQEALRKLYGCDKAFFCVNGSSGGNLASIFDAFNEGDEVLVERNCHKSIYNALILRKLKVIYIEPNIVDECDIFLPPCKEKIFSALKKSENPKGIILTYPNYFGIGYEDLDELIGELKNKGLRIILDGAHGAHFGINKDLPKSLVKEADYIVLSAHKTLPSLTQGAFLLTNGENNVEFYLRAFMTTSPSYLIMASLDYSRYYLEKYGNEDYKKLIDLCEKWKSKINSIEGISIIDQSNLPKGYSIDKTRYNVLLDVGYSGHILLDELRKRKVQCEMSWSRGAVLILSPFNGEEDFKKIYNALSDINLNSLKCEESNGFISVIPEKRYEPFEVFNMKWEEVYIKNSEGRVSKDAIIPYPPGIPLVSPGEIISKDIIEIIEGYINGGREVIGIANNKIKTLQS
ncbi:MAG: aminotransferase class I/II-fold pyridoxal phosphate-dependent enzyme [Clostridium sp.]